MDDSSSSSTASNGTWAPPYLHADVADADAKPSWAERMETLSHILTHPTLTLAPSLHSQLFVSVRVPCFVHREWGFPPFLCPSPGALSSFSLALFLSRASRLGLPRTSWRSRCPFQQPPPCLLSSAVTPAPDRCGPQERRAYATQRLRRGRFGSRHPPELLLFVIPNIALFSLVLLFDPRWLWCRPS